MNYLIKSIIFLFLFLNTLLADCSDLDYNDCLYWAGYCEWNEETNACQDAGAVGGDNYEVLTEADGISQSTLYNGALLYYPTEGNPPFESIILLPAFGGAGSMDGWAQFYASNGYIAMSIGNFDRNSRDWDTEWDYMDRALGMLDAIETVKAENIRVGSPLYGNVDTTSFSVSGHSTSGGGAHTAAILDPSIKSAILLNSAMAVLDSVNCPGIVNVSTGEIAYYCLLEQHLDHEVPTLVFAGEYEYEELVTPDDSTYGGMWALVQYDYIPETTDKLYFESANQGHSSAQFPDGDVAEFALFWLKYYSSNLETYCDSLILDPGSTSQFLTTIDCNTSTLVFDVNDDGLVDDTDLNYLVVSIINENTLDILGDVNFDQNIDIFDLLTLSDYLN